MGFASPIHWLILLVWIGGFLVPLAMVLQKAGFSRMWTLFAIIPLLSLIPLWMLAVRRWEVVDQ